MKIGIVTVYDSSNLGSYLQAYALKNFLEKEGHEVYFVKQRSIFIEYIKTILRSLKSSIRYGIKVLFFNLAKCIQNYSDLKKLKTINIKNINSQSIDAVILGSDEIWNVNKPYFRNTSFWGDVNLEFEKIVGYAISCGTATAEDVEKYNELCKLMKNLKYVFTRDSATKEIVEEITGKRNVEVCDPTILVDKEVLFVRESTSYEDYVVVYGYRFSKKQIEFIEKYAKEHNKKIVSICLYQNWCQNINISALEFGNVLGNAFAVVTNTFHGTIFSILSHASFVSLAETNKVKDLLKKLKLEHKQCVGTFEYKRFVNVLEEKPKYEIVDEIITSMRKQSAAKLNQVLSEIK